MNSAASQLVHRGMTVLIATPPEEHDFNDVLVRDGDPAGRDRLEAVRTLQPEESTTRRKRLFTFGSDEEIVAARGARI